MLDGCELVDTHCLSPMVIVTLCQFYGLTAPFKPTDHQAFGECLMQGAFMCYISRSDNGSVPVDYLGMSEI